MGGGGGSVTDKAIALPIDDTRMANANCWRWVMVRGGVGWGPSYHLCIYALDMFEIFWEKKKGPISVNLKMRTNLGNKDG